MVQSPIRMRQEAWFLGKIFMMADLAGLFMAINPHRMSCTEDKLSVLIQLAAMVIGLQR